MNKHIIFFIFICQSLLSQEIPLPALKIGEEICISANNSSSAAHSTIGTRPLNDAPGLSKFSKEKRIDIQKFGVLDINGNIKTIKDHYGKIVLLCFWTPSCQGSLRALKSMKNFQAEEKRGDFVVWPIHNDGWPWISSFIRKKHPEYEGIKIFKAGIGENGMHVLGNEIVAVPMIYIIDRKGRIAASYSGYRSNFLPNLLNEYYTEHD